MYIQEAIKSGKPFKRKVYTNWFVDLENTDHGLALEGLSLFEGDKVYFFPSSSDILADDWEIKPDNTVE